MRKKNWKDVEVEVEASSASVVSSCSAQAAAQIPRHQPPSSTIDNLNQMLLVMGSSSLLSSRLSQCATILLWLSLHRFGAAVRKLNLLKMVSRSLR